MGDEEDDFAEAAGKDQGGRMDSKSFRPPSGGTRGKGRTRRMMPTLDHFLCFCTKCGHGFHAEHARLWFQGRRDGYQGAWPGGKTVGAGADGGADGGSVEQGEG